MPMKGSGPATDYRVIDRREDGVGWLAYPGERMERASHAIATDEGAVWLVDPVDVEGLAALLGEYGEVDGVVTLLDRHRRDAAEIASRHDVAVHVPAWMTGVAGELDAPVERFDGELADTGWRVHRVVDNRFWQEGALEIAERDTLLVPETVGTAAYFLAPGERLGVHPMLRLVPPRTLRRFSPDRVLVGHGAGIHDGATAALAEAIDGSRSKTLGLVGKILKNAVGG